MLDDLRYAIRGLARSRGLFAVLLVTLALGTGANVAIYGVLDALLFRAPPSIEDADSLLSIHTSEFSGASYGPTSYDDFSDIAARVPALSGAAAVDDGHLENVSMRGTAQQMRVAEVSPGFFDLLGMRPAAGQFPRPDAAAAVVSHALWTAAGRPHDIIGAPVAVGGDEYIVAAVAPERFRGHRLGRPTDVWVPVRRQEGRGDRRFTVLARLHDGVSPDETAAQLQAVASALAEAHPETNRGTVTGADDPRRLSAAPYAFADPSIRATTRTIGAIILSATLLLLASAAVNAGALLLSRALARRREFAVKLALGATRARIARQTIVEATIVAVTGAGAGLIVAVWTLGAIPALFSPDHAAMLDTRLSPSAILATVAIACAAGLALGLVPALQGAGAPPAALRADAGGMSDSSGGSLRGTFVAAQVALSTLLVLATGILAASLAATLDAGLDAGGRRVAIVTMTPPRPGMTNPAYSPAYQQRALTAIAKLNGIDRAAWAGVAPLAPPAVRRFSIEAGGATLADTVELDVNVVTAAYFRVAGMALIEGTLFTGDERPRDTPVVIVNDTLARRYLGAAAAGHRLRDADGRTFEIVGVVRAARYRSLQEAPRPTVYYPATQEPLPRVHLMVRGRDGRAPDLEVLRATLLDVDRGALIESARTLEAHLRDALVLDRMIMRLVAVCGAIGLLMAAVGMYGVMNDTVRRRTREIGLRIALGASPRRLAGLVLGSSAWLAAGGTAAGLFLTFVLGRIAGALVHGVPGVAPASAGWALAAIAAIVLLAALLPLRRALSISPTVALRAE